MAVEIIRLGAIGGMRLHDMAFGPDGMEGRLLGAYLLLEQVGAGAHAAVYRARHEVMGIERAVKVLRSAVAGCSEQRTRFVREASIASRIRHPNVVSVFDCGIELDGAAYLVMEYVAGRTLAQRLGAGRLAPAQALPVAGQVAAGLDHAHRLGVVHGDVKPANILLDQDGEARLSDFGIARLEREPEPKGGALVALGTPAYMSPEQCAGRRGEMSPRSDVYSLAVVLYEMLTGRLPYGQGRAALAGHLGSAGPVPPHVANPCLPEAVDRVLSRGLAREPQGRYASAGRLVADLAAVLARVQEPAGRRHNRSPFLPTSDGGGRAAPVRASTRFSVRLRR